MLAGIATVDAAGNVTGVSSGSITITYTITNSCATVDSTYSFLVNDVPVVASITGTHSLCVGATSTLGDATLGGVWVSGDATIATVDGAGNVFGVDTGTVYIYYSVTGTCGTTATTDSITVSAVPVVAGITSSATTFCSGTTVTVADAATGGTWTTSDATIATVNRTGVVTGVSAGLVNITYTLTSACSSVDTTISLSVISAPVIGSITGTTSFCVGMSSALADTTVGGTWSTSDAAIATIDATGTVTGIVAGSDVISYTVTNVCGTTNMLVNLTINDMPGIAPIGGTLAICGSGTTIASDATTGGVWSSGNMSVATIDASGNITAVSAGSTEIYYTVTSSFGCTASDSALFTSTAAPVLSAISGPSGTTVGGVVTLTNSTSGGVWTSSRTGIATINSSTGVATGVSVGVDSITYTVTTAGGCTASVTRALFVSGSLASSAIYPGGSVTLCHSAAIPLAIFTPDSTDLLSYQWYLNGVAISGATDSFYVADTIGVFTATISNAAGSSLLTGVTVLAPPNPIISVTGGNILYTGSFTTYQWFHNGSAIPGSTSSVQVEIGLGSYQVAVTDAHGCLDTSAVFMDTLVTNSVANVNLAQIRLYPNPATSVITIESSVKVNVAIFTADGKMAIRKEDAASVDVSQLASGMYVIMIYDENNVLLKVDKFMKVE